MTSFSTRNRRGSALLIVLGFLSFMVVSAIAFAVFMRAERAPSSALRRGVATRHLVKAALARAMSDVDDAIRNDTFPGQAGSGNGGTFYKDRRNNAMDVWYGRVFMPPDTEGSTQPGDDTTRFAPISETVSTLCLEALGYLPAPLVNDVRFLSRCSWAAKWQNLPYDSGRYAYTAVNVSDYFDINLLWANRGRSSQDNGRITLAPVFKDQSGKKVETSAASAFDTFVHQQRVTDSEGASATTPYVSMLDYNLALGEKYQDAGLGGKYNSPFWTWINNPSQPVFYQTLATNEGSQVAYARRQTFVTDSWFPTQATSSGSSDTNLLYEAAQPFKQATLDKGSDAGALPPIGETTKFKQVMQTDRQYLNLSDWISLFDYLDRDDLPTSLALPCVERVPMTAALEPAFQFQFKGRVEKVVTTDPATPVQGQGYKQITTYTVKLNASHFPQAAGLRAVFAFPFKRGKDLNAGNTFKAQAMLRLFFVASQNENQIVQLRGGNQFENLRPKDGEWNSAQAFALSRGGQGAVLTYLSRQKTLGYPSKVTDEEEAFMDNGNTMFSDLSLQGMRDVTFVTRTETVQMSSSGNPQGQPEVAWAFPDNVRPFSYDGTPLPDMAGDTYSSWFIRPYVAMWVRVEGNDGVVDYVPAMVDDDQELGGVANRQINDLGASRINTGDSAGTPLLRVMDKATPLAFGTMFAAAMPGGADFIAPNAAEWEPKSFYTVDPRYNWAPEDWLPKSKSATRDEWLQSLDSVLGQNGCDPDIFMAVSNQGYLQSMGEIAMLPRLTDDSGSTIAIPFDGAVRTTDCEWNKIAHAATAWRTYPADYEWDDDARKTDGLFYQGISADGNGFRVNPYTDSPQVMKTALELTPYDWWAAGTNNVSKGPNDNKTSISIKKQMQTSITKALDYAFSEECDEAKLAQEDVDWLASYLMGQFKANPTKKWEDVYDSLPWYATSADQDKLFGRKLANNLVLHNVDRKYLHAFWRGCFANKQQLFLIFVRAESNALGGPGEGTPSQKGGRAVALVWRDPNLSANAQDYQDSNQNYTPLRHPHAMRILFYHQFD